MIMEKVIHSLKRCLFRATRRRVLLCVTIAALVPNVSASLRENEQYCDIGAELEFLEAKVPDLPEYKPNEKAKPDPAFDTILGPILRSRSQRSTQEVKPPTLNKTPKSRNTQKPKTTFTSDTTIAGKCPDGHGLKKLATQKAHECSICDVLVSPSTTESVEFYLCKKCKYYECVDCRHLRNLPFKDMNNILDRVCVGTKLLSVLNNIAFVTKGVQIILSGGKSYQLEIQVSYSDSGPGPSPKKPKKPRTVRGAFIVEDFLMDDSDSYCLGTDCFTDGRLIVRNKHQSESVELRLSIRCQHLELIWKAFTWMKLHST